MTLNSAKHNEMKITKSEKLFYISTEQHSRCKPSPFCLSCNLKLWGYLIFKNKKSFQSSTLNEANQSHIQSLIYSLLPRCLLGSYSENWIKAPRLGCYKDTLQTQFSCAITEFCALIHNQQKMKKNMRETLWCSIAKRCNRCNLEDDLFNQRFSWFLMLFIKTFKVHIRKKSHYIDRETSLPFTQLHEYFSRNPAVWRNGRYKIDFCVCK